MLFFSLIILDPEHYLFLLTFAVVEVQHNSLLEFASCDHSLILYWQDYLIAVDVKQEQAVTTDQQAFLT